MTIRLAATHLGVGLLLLLVLPLQAEVTHRDANGFISEHELVLEASPARAFAAFLEVSAWWDAAHSYSGKAAAFTLEPRAGGCFCERAEGVEVEHMRVVNVQQNRSIVLRGGLGPLQALAVAGSMRFDFEALPNEPERTLLKYRYSVGGYRPPDGLAAWADPVDAVQLGQLQRLARYVAAGSPSSSVD